MRTPPDAISCAGLSSRRGMRDIDAELTKDQQRSVGPRRARPRRACCAVQGSSRAGQGLTRASTSSDRTCPGGPRFPVRVAEAGEVDRGIVIPVDPGAAGCAVVLPLGEGQLGFRRPAL